ncbi:hypothetical protein [Microlunatus kandeliicorticis]|uniref:hypothetical protein n=1 Tax=Microlunatus kandeliicorticis TaxID=1759536 RepID=UPI0015F84B4B|nr:hypothetical protein [Microlunatus kandeliicorticis]
MDWGSIQPGRVQRFERAVDTQGVADRLDRLAAVAVTGLGRMYERERRSFPQTVRGFRSDTGPDIRPEGDSLRYAAIAALGIGLLPIAQQRQILNGDDARGLTALVIERALRVEDLGAVALAAWAAAEVGHHFAEDLFLHIDRRISSSHPIDVVECSWALTAAVSASRLAKLDDLTRKIERRLSAAQGPGGLFPHVLSPLPQKGVRSHVGCFADQVYPIQALARLHLLTGNPAALERADACAERIVALQGKQGQWWWHYDARSDAVVERFPVYSVHQHAMAPMALLDLAEAGGANHSAAIARGLGWIDNHPEALADLVSERLGVIWRKVGRREPRKLARGLAATLTSRRPGSTLPLLDRLLPPGPIDYECRPYELGWLLYAWSGTGALSAISGADSRA